MAFSFPTYYGGQRAVRAGLRSLTSLVYHLVELVWSPHDRLSNTVRPYDTETPVAFSSGNYNSRNCPGKLTEVVEHPTESSYITLPCMLPLLLQPCVSVPCPKLSMRLHLRPVSVIPNDSKAYNQIT